MKKCLYCAEEVQDEAVLCRFCGRRLDEVLVPSLVKRLNKWLLVGALAVVVLGTGAAAVVARRERQPARCPPPASMSEWLSSEKSACDVPIAHVCQNLQIGGLLRASLDDQDFLRFRAEHGEAGAIMAAVELVRTQRRRAGCPEVAPASATFSRSQADHTRRRFDKPGRTLFDASK